MLLWKLSRSHHYLSTQSPWRGESSQMQQLWWSGPHLHDYAGRGGTWEKENEMMSSNKASEAAGALLTFDRSMWSILNSSQTLTQWPASQLERLDWYRLAWQPHVSWCWVDNTFYILKSNNLCSYHNCLHRWSAVNSLRTFLPIFLHLCAILYCFVFLWNVVRMQQ